MNLGVDAREWAIEQLVAGRDSRYLRQLAGTTDADHYAEVEDLFDRTLRELGIDALDPNSAVTLYAQEFTREYLTGRVSRESLLRELCKLCIATGYDRRIYPFYLLRWTLEDLNEQEFSFYRQDVTRENFDEVLQFEIKALLSIH